MNTSFMNAMANELDNQYNFSQTENGALGYATTNKPLLDMNFKITSYRNRSDAEIVKDFIKALNQNFELSVAWLFYARDAREGVGERRLFRVLIKDLAKTHPKLVKKLLLATAEYGRWDDLLVLLDTSVSRDVVALIKQQLTEDAKNLAEGKSISLLAKWLPSVNTSSSETRAIANKLCVALETTPRNYRKLLSTLRKHLQIVESKMSANEWDQINYEAVPSKANLIYKDAFLKHDEDRRSEFLAKVESGEAKINSGVNFPHDIVHKYGFYVRRAAVDPTVEALWKALPDFGLEDTICVADGSGSMFTCVDRKSSVQAIEVANALAIYAAEHCKGAFKNTYITFSSRPQIVHLKGKTLLDNLRTAYEHDEVANTNVKAVFDLILRTAVNSKMSQEDLPKNILILSDMEFDYATRSCGPRIDARLFDQIQREYEAHGYKVPKLIFWNICGRTDTIPMVQNDLGVILVSGFSVNVMKMVMSDKLDPWAALVDTLTSERYQPVLKLAAAYYGSEK